MLLSAAARTKLTTVQVKQLRTVLIIRTDPPSNCGPRYVYGESSPNPTVSPPMNKLPTSGNNTSSPPQPPKNAIPPSSTLSEQTRCPNGSTPDADGNCPGPTTNQQVSPSLNSGEKSESNNNNNNNNKPSVDHHQHHHKGSDLGQESTTTTKKGNDNSSTDSQEKTTTKTKDHQKR